MYRRDYSSSILVGFKYSQRQRPYRTHTFDSRWEGLHWRRSGNHRVTVAQPTLSPRPRTTPSLCLRICNADWTQTHSRNVPEVPPNPQSQSPEHKLDDLEGEVAKKRKTLQCWMVIWQWYNSRRFMKQTKLSLDTSFPVTSSATTALRSGVTSHTFDSSTIRCIITTRKAGFWMR